MRFNNMFDFKITKSKEIEDDMALPPLLLQPFVENAIIHGMKDKVNQEGEIYIEFNKTEKGLSITITDNGKGFDKNKPQQKKSSLGMSITEKRIAHIQKSSKGAYQLDIDSNENGTTVRILIICFLNH